MSMRPSTRGRHRLLAILTALFAAALAIALSLSDTATIAPGVRDAAPPATALAAPPAVLPFELAETDPDRARASNARVAVAPGVPVAALPFRYAGLPADRAAAQGCLAAAVWYEAGDDRAGEQAVAQVVLNRLRHPAFPKTVCGVVFQGSERRTGCQFTFTCDGALGRTPSRAAWMRAQAIAEAALSGFVVRPVGTATHYHAEYVVPYWRDSLEKIGVIGPHIFYRWAGWWGSRAAFSGRLQPGEPLNPRVAALAGLAPGLLPDLPDAFADGDGPARQSLAVTGVPQAALNGSLVRLKDEEGGQFILQLGAAANPKSFPITAFNLCGARDNCIVMGWLGEHDVPRAFPVLPQALRHLAFLYRRTEAVGIAQSYWDCARFPRPLPAQCLAGTGPR